MRTRVYKFRIEYELLENDIWREVEVLSDMRLDRFGYLVFSTFDTLGTKDFAFSFRATDFCSMPSWARIEIHGANPTATTLSSMKFVTNSVLYVFYDLIRDQTFKARFLGAEEINTEYTYPRIVDGRGIGIIEEVTSTELGRRIARIRRLGMSDELYLPLDADGYAPWDINAYDMAIDNSRLHDRMERFENYYLSRV